MSVYVIARLSGSPRVRSNHFVPEGWGAWVASFPGVREAREWVHTADRETYVSGDKPCQMAIVGEDGFMIVPRA